MTILSNTDYSVDYSYIVENNLDSPHLFFLHDGSVPPIESIGMLNENLPKLRLKAFTDDCGMGHLGRLGENGRQKKLIRFDPPNVVRHGGVSGFEEEFHIIPVAPQVSKVLLSKSKRQVTERHKSHAYSLCAEDTSASSSAPASWAYFVHYFKCAGNDFFLDTPCQQLELPYCTRGCRCHARSS